MSRYWHTPIRIVAGKTLAWYKSGRTIRGLPEYTLQAPGTARGRPLTFPMKGGHAKGCVQDMTTPD